MDIVVLICLPVLSGFIGWLTNWVAIKMLFRPREAVSFLGVRLHGVIPRRKGKFAKTIGEVVERDILSTHRVRSTVEGIDLGPYVPEVARRLVRGELAQKLKGIPFIGSMINEETLGEFERMAEVAIQKEAKGIMGRVAQEAEGKLQVQSIIEEEINGFDMEKLEGMIEEVAAREFRTIEVLGAVLGFVIGVVQVAVVVVFG